MLIGFGILLALIYWPSIYGPATSSRLAFLAVSLPILLLLTHRKVNLTLVHVLGLCLIAWSILSLVWTSNRYDGIDETIALVIVAEAFVLGTYLSSLKGVFVGLGVGLTFSSMLVLIGAKSGLFVNVNMLAETAVIVAVGLWIYNAKWFIVGLLPAIVMNGSRAAILTGVGFLIFKTSKWLFLIVACVAFLVILSLQSNSLGERYIIWSDTVSGLTLLGNGIGSFFTSYPFLTDDFDTVRIRPKYAHNDLLQLTFELGLVGLLLALSLCWMVLKSGMEERYIFAAFLAISCFSFPFHLPVTAFIAALVCGHVVHRWSDVRLPSIDGGMALCSRGLCKVRSVLSV